MRPILLAVGLVALRSGAVIASPCGGGGDSSGGSFDFGGSSDDDSSSSSAEPCVGPCADYKAWQQRHAPAVTLDIGVGVRSIASPLGAANGTVTHDMQSFAYRVVGPAAQPAAPLDTAVIAQLRIGAPLRYHLYVAGELEGGALTTSRVRTEMMTSGELGTPTLTAGSTALIGAAGVLGIGGRIGGVDLGIEVAGGVRGLSYAYDSTYLSCETTSSISAAQAVVEGRARASMWLSPRMSLTVLAGKSALDEGMVGGFAIGFTNQPYARR